MIKLQTLKNKKGEITFRKKLKKQLELKKTFFPSEPNANEYLSILKSRVRNYRKVFGNFHKDGIVLNPFLEFGAGNAQGSMLLINEFASWGIASDISFDNLAYAKKIVRKLKFKKIPELVVADAYHLPFNDNSFSFVFCFATLHHFPDPKPILEEVRRVLKRGGYFYFGEEPVSQKFNLGLWRRGHHLRWWEKLLKMSTLLHFLSRIGKSEVENNILEETFDLKTWEAALNIFGEVSTELVIFPFGKVIQRTKTRKKGWLKPPFPLNLILGILGGGIGALCKKRGALALDKPQNLVSLFSCPTCRVGILKKTTKGFSCPNCKEIYKRKNEIHILLPKSENEILYGDILDNNNK